MRDRHSTRKRINQEEECFKALFREHFASMCMFADRYLKDEDAVRDVVHDVFYDLWERPMDSENVRDIKNYLYTMVRNRCVDIIRKKEIHHRYMEFYKLEVGEQEFFDTEVLREDIYRLLDQAIQLLPGRSREILLLKMQGLKNQEIADKLEISINTVNTLKANAYKVLREQLQDKFLLCLFFLFRKLD